MNTKINLSVILMLIFCTISFAQEKTVSGKITEDSGIPLPGVNILVKGTSIGALSDFDGNYSLQVEAGQTLIFSYLGFKTEEKLVGNEATINMIMYQDATSLDEIVVTALGISRSKKSLGYATQQIESEDISKAKGVNFVNSLSGKLAGVTVSRNNNFGGSTNVIIRGYSSLTGNNQPLFVIDGTPISNRINNSRNSTAGRGGYDYGNAASDINPDDIETINVLKGAAASALYGSRAGNGVIIITTKKGTKNKGLGITINSNTTFSKFDPKTFARYQKEYGGGYGASFVQEDVDGDGILDNVVDTGGDASWGPRFDPNLSVYQWGAFFPENPNYRTPTPWVAAKNDPTSIFQTGLLQSTNISVDGASDKGDFRLGFTNVEQTGILPNSLIKRQTVDFGGSYKLTDKVTARAKVTYTKNSGRGRFATGYDENSVLPGLRQWYQTNVDLREQRDAYFRLRRNATWNIRSSARTGDDPYAPRPQYWDNPYWTLYENYQTDGRDRVFGNVALTYKVNDWFDVLARVTMDRFDEIREERVNVSSFNPSEYNRFNGFFREMNYDMIGNFNFDITEKLNFKGLLGMNLTRTNRSSIFAETNGGLNTFGFYSLSNSVNPIAPPIERKSSMGVNGYYASASFGYDDILFLDATYRIDRSSTLPDGKRQFNYPSISTSFLFSNLFTSDWLNFGKLRLNYAEVGNSAGVLLVDDVYTFVNGFAGQSLFSLPNNKNNPTLKHETVISYEAGLEMKFFKNRFGFDITAYQTNSKDQILPLDISTSTGFNSKIVNAGEIENKGYEVSLFGTPIKTENFEWNINVNWSTYKSEVVSLLDGIDNLSLSGTLQEDVSINATVGEPYGTIRGSSFKYLNGQRVVDENGYYVTNEENGVIGNIIPDWNGGINNTFRYKNASLSFLIDMQKGGDIYSLDHTYGYATGIFPETAGLNDLGNPIRDAVADGGGIIAPGVREDGTPNTVRTPVNSFDSPFIYYRSTDEQDVYDASFVKLREVIFSYSLPSKLLDNLPVNDVVVSLIGRNLWIIDKNIPYSDPEAGLSAGNLQGFQSSAYPTSKEYGFNLKVKF
ncbi:SusC/RagA family TonB-linked outer membrane protein [Aquimarina megaterium]|uniref:SusC/RagA family TonB-linked outer membrane protein n=1 Tax=Aquimarina megaterium TaxID=1443666 RepID=UPI000472872E|nr:SusC/RagA family TonB-linked outer membrane protein [Aquimarina megaterium]